MSRIYFISNQKVMMDRDLAERYGVETQHLKQAVRRNSARFPVNLQVIRIFTRMREMMPTQKDILLPLEKIQQKLGTHDEQIERIFLYLKQLLNTPQAPSARIGFRRSNE